MKNFVHLVDIEKYRKNEYLVGKIGFDTAENEPLKVCQKVVRTSKSEKTGRINIGHSASSPNLRVGTPASPTRPKSTPASPTKMRAASVPGRGYA